MSLIATNGVLSSIPGQPSAINVSEFEEGPEGVLNYLKDGMLNKEYRDRTLRDLAIFKVLYIEAAWRDGAGWLLEPNLRSLLERFDVDFDLFTKGSIQKKRKDVAYQDFANDKKNYWWVIWLFRASFRFPFEGSHSKTKRYKISGGDLLVEKKSLTFARQAEDRGAEKADFYRDRVAYAYFRTVSWRFQELEFEVLERLLHPADSAVYQAIIKFNSAYRYSYLGLTRSKGSQSSIFQSYINRSSSFRDVLVNDLAIQFSYPKNYISIYNILKELRSVILYSTRAERDDHGFFFGGPPEKKLIAGFAASYYDKVKMESLMDKMRAKVEQQQQQDQKSKVDSVISENADIEWSE